MAASTTSSPLSLSSSSSALIHDAKPAPSLPRHQSPLTTLPTSGLSYTTTAYCRKIARGVAVMATGEAPAAASAAEAIATTETPEIVKTIQDAWEKVEDKYAVSSLVVAGGVALWGSAGMISAIDRLPLIPGVLELVGIGYTVWFAYKNLVFKPDREALIQEIKDTYKDIIGSS